MLNKTLCRSSEKSHGSVVWCVGATCYFLSFRFAFFVVFKTTGVAEANKAKREEYVSANRYYVSNLLISLDLDFTPFSAIITKATNTLRQYRRNGLGPDPCIHDVIKQVNCTLSVIILIHIILLKGSQIVFHCCKISWRSNGRRWIVFLASELFVGVLFASAGDLSVPHKEGYVEGYLTCSCRFSTFFWRYEIKGNIV